MCDGTILSARGTSKNIEAMEKSAGPKVGETSSGCKCTAGIVYCMGSCGLAPVAVVDGKVHSRLTPNAL
ncbi:MAG: NAD(P)H-dependent oxidoreductase subunit E [Pseudomonadota bacterium]|nr:NAD(P)H-dependent oxidoreductase subunit E [Pseudomonadota bacterium]